MAMSALFMHPVTIRIIPPQTDNESCNVNGITNRIMD